MTDGARTYVLDTNVLLDHPDAVAKLCADGHKVVLPWAVINELDKKKTHRRLGYQARAVLRTVEEARGDGRLSEGVPFGTNGGMLYVKGGKPLGKGSGDRKILKKVRNLAIESDEPLTLLSRDRTVRLRAGEMEVAVDGKLAVDTYDPPPVDASPPFFVVTPKDMGRLHQSADVDVVDGESNVRPLDLPLHSMVLVAESLDGSPVPARVVAAPDGGRRVRLIQGEPKLFELDPRRQTGPNGEQTKEPNREQMLALDILRDPAITLVSLSGGAGTGKTALAVLAGLEALQNRLVKKVVVFRPVTPMQGQDVGFMPGSEKEKMARWKQAIYDSVERVGGSAALKAAEAKGTFEFGPLTAVRGQTRDDCWIVVDESQQLSFEHLEMALTRKGKGSKMVLAGDVGQVDSETVGTYDGVAAWEEILLAEQEKGEKAAYAYAPVRLGRSERDEMVDLVVRAGKRRSNEGTRSAAPRTGAHLAIDTPTVGEAMTTLVTVPRGRTGGDAPTVTVAGRVGAAVNGASPDGARRPA